jgi:hypothetical protein
MRQPSGSKIQISKSIDRLEITIPARFRPDRVIWHQIGMTSLVTGIALFLGGVVAYISIQLSAASNDVAVKVGLCVGLLFTVPFLLWVGKASLRLLFELFDRFSSHLYLEIDDRQLKMVTRLLTLDRSRPQTVKTNEIYQIIIDRYRTPKTNEKQANLVLDLAQERSVKLLMSGQNLTASEIEWLAEKLSKYLDISIFNNDEIKF